MKVTQRTKEEIGKDYGALMKKAAELQYTLYILQKDLALTNEALEEINLEAAGLPQEQS